MSKLGKINITVPEKVNVSFNNGIVDIKGPIGSKQINIDPNKFTLEVKEKNISIKPKEINDTNKRFWGLNRSLINNAVIGVDKGFEKTLELVGVGYRAAIKGNMLNLQLGFSHDINFEIPKDIKITVEKQTTIKIVGSDKQLVGVVSSKIKALRKPEPYKGKGIREKGQYILRKEGKKK
ncbi:MAG: 50S ribosomal protein L6 [Candidatus Pelagibacterales bacterium]|nr:MAG: 50S ribosomal protein L6 [Pelagibacterales bacterium]|tara:strand:+ start:324 stop:860 length:537 start_codon:yes stop_codon:yes gene_type:complete